MAKKKKSNDNGCITAILWIFAFPFVLMYQMVKLAVLAIIGIVKFIGAKKPKTSKYEIQRKIKDKVVWIILGIFTLLLPAIFKNDISKVIVFLLMLFIDVSVVYIWYRRKHQIKKPQNIKPQLHKQVDNAETGVEETPDLHESISGLQVNLLTFIEDIKSETDPFLFFTSYDMAVNTFTVLSIHEQRGFVFNGGSPSADFEYFSANKEVIFNNFIKRSFEKLECEVKLLDTYSDKKEVIEEYYKIILEHKDRMTMKNGYRIDGLVESLEMEVEDEFYPIQRASYDKRSKIVSIFTKKWLDIAERELIVIDIETTGLSKIIDSMVEVAAIRYKHGVEVDKYVTLINPKVIIPAEVIQIHNITNEMVKDAPTIDKVIPELLNFLGDSLLVGHNANFDIGFIEVAAIRLGYSPFWNYVDTVSVAKKIFKELGLPNYKQGTILDAIGYKQKEYHRAEDDCRGCAEIMNIAINSLIGSN